MKDTADPEITQKILAIGKAYDEATNKHDDAALAALFTEDAVFVTDRGPVYGRQAIEKWYADQFQGWRPQNHLSTFDGDVPHAIGTAGNELWATGEWSETGQGKNGEPIPIKGYWLIVFVREADDWKIRLDAWNITPDSVILLNQKLGSQR